MKDLFSVKNKVIILTGGAGALGAQYHVALKKAGARVVVWDKTKVAGEEIVDITNEASVEQAVKNILKKYGRIDVLINNAAMNPAADSPDAKSLFKPYEDYPVELWEKELRVNLTGMLICTKQVAKVMIKQKSGSIINVASDLSVMAHDHRVYNVENKFKSIAYTTTKAGVLGFTRQWAARLGRYGIRVNAFSPTGARKKGDKLSPEFIARFGGATMFGRMGEPTDYIGPIIFLSSNASAFMTAQNLIVDGGKTAW